LEINKELRGGRPSLEDGSMGRDRSLFQQLLWKKEFDRAEAELRWKEAYSPIVLTEADIEHYESCEKARQSIVDEDEKLVKLFRQEQAAAQRPSKRIKK
nr:hypothetical protein [Tanacetum cinerariifolium]